MTDYPPFRMVVTRDVFAPTFTLGEMTVFGCPDPDVLDGAGEIWTCEDTDRGLDSAKPDGFAAKIHGKTAIPYGVYRVALTHSERFHVVLPLLLAVPAFRGIRIHSLNNSDQSDGCIGLGSTRDIVAGTIGNSRATCRVVQGWIADAIRRGVEVTCEIRRASP